MHNVIIAFNNAVIANAQQHNSKNTLHSVRVAYDEKAQLARVRFTHRTNTAQLLRDNELFTLEKCAEGIVTRYIAAGNYKLTQQTRGWYALVACAESDAQVRVTQVQNAHNSNAQTLVDDGDELCAAQSIMQNAANELAAEQVQNAHDSVATTATPVAAPANKKRGPRKR